MQNITQTVSFPVNTIIASPIDGGLKDLLMMVRHAKRLMDDNACRPDELKDLSDRLDDITPPKVKKEMAAFGANSLAEDVNVNLQLGTALFDVYVRMTPEPQAPLAKLIWRKKTTELAEVLDAAEITIPEHALEKIRTGLTDESVWASLSLSAWVEVKAEDGSPSRRYFSISPAGTKYFNKILDAAAEMVYNDSRSDA